MVWEETFEGGWYPGYNDDHPHESGWRCEFDFATNCVHWISSAEHEIKYAPVVQERVMGADGWYLRGSS